MGTERFEDDARGRKAQLLVAYLIHLGIKCVDDWDALEWEVIAEGASEHHGVKVHSPSSREPRTTHWMVAEHLKGYWKRQELLAARGTSA